MYRIVLIDLFLSGMVVVDFGKVLMFGKKWVSFWCIVFIGLMVIICVFVCVINCVNFLVLVFRFKVLEEVFRLIIFFS